jgi:hypothetical protein
MALQRRRQVRRMATLSLWLGVLGAVACDPGDFDALMGADVDTSPVGRDSGATTPQRCRDGGCDASEALGDRGQRDATVGEPDASESRDAALDERARLTALSTDVGQLSPSFSPDTLDYQVRVPRTRAELTLSVTATMGATVRVGGALAGSTHVLGLRAFASETGQIEIEVSAPGQESTHYVLDVTWAFAEPVELINPDSKTGSQFGSSLAISGNAIVVGDWAADSAPSAEDDVGRAYVYERAKPGEPFAEAPRILSPPDGASPGAQLGRDVAIDGDTIVVGEWLWGATGRALVFQRGTTWDAGTAIYPTTSNPDASQHFGWAVAVAGDAIAVSDFRYDSPALPDVGLVHLYERGVQDWPWVASETSSVPATFAYFGIALAMDGDTLAVGAYAGDAGMHGTIELFDIRSGLSFLQRLGPNTAGEGNDQLGKAVGMDGATLVAGAPFAGNPDYFAGAAYVSERGALWSPLERLAAPSSQLNRCLGLSVAVSGDVIVVGSPNEGRTMASCEPTGPGAPPSGVAYVLRRSAGSWELLDVLRADGAISFGSAVAIAGDTVVVGAAFTKQEITQGAADMRSTGRAFVFE